MKSLSKERLNQWEGRAGDDLVRCRRIQHNDCAETNDNKVGALGHVSQCLDRKRGVLEV